MLEKKPFLF